MRRTALGVCRYAGAISPGSRYWTAIEIVWPAVRSGTPGLSRRTMRRSAPRPGAMNSGVRRTSGSICAQRQRRACMAEALGRMSGPGSIHGASSPALRRVETNSSRAVAVVVWVLMTGSVLQPSRVGDPRPVLGDGAAVHAQVDAGDHPGVVRRKKDGGLRVIAWARQPVHRQHPGEVEHPAAALGPRPPPVDGTRVAFLHVGRRWREAVDADAVAHQVHGRRPGEVEQPALAGAVADVAGLALVAGRGHDHDDAAARRALDHQAGDVLGAEKGAGEVHGELALPALERHVEHALAAEDAGVVDEHVDRAVRLTGPRDHRLHLALVGDVARHPQRLPAVTPDGFRALARALADVVRSYGRDVTPYYPFTASEQGRREYDRVLANDIGAPYRNGMLAICTRYRDGLRGIDAGALSDAERVTYDVFAFRLETCVAGYQFPWHL